MLASHKGAGLSLGCCFQFSFWLMCLGKLKSLGPCIHLGDPEEASYFGKANLLLLWPSGEWTREWRSLCNSALQGKINLTGVGVWNESRLKAEDALQVTRLESSPHSSLSLGVALLGSFHITGTYFLIASEGQGPECQDSVVVMGIAPQSFVSCMQF